MQQRRPHKKPYQKKSPESTILQRVSEQPLLHVPFLSIGTSGSARPASQKPFQPVVARETVELIPMGEIKKEEGIREGSSAMEPMVIFCQPSELQKQLRDAIGYLMTINESEQRRLQLQLCNHPCLLFMRIDELSAGFENRSGKKAKREFVNFSGVLSKFPTGYERDHSLCRVSESGKLSELFKMVTSAALTDDEVNPARIIVVSRYIRTLDLLQQLFEEINPKLDFSIYRFDKTPITILREEMERACGDVGRKLILLNINKDENLRADLFDGAHLIFYDFDHVNDERTISSWNKAGVKTTIKLITRDTIEEEECPSNLR